MSALTDTSEWQGRVGDAWAEEYRRTDRSLAALTERLLSATRGRTFDQALDIGCGAGELSLALARGRPDAQIVGIDISPQLTDVASSRAANMANVTFECADAATWQSGEGAEPELLMSRHGVMFFDDPAAAFANLHTVSAPGATLLFSCFRAFEENPFFTELVRQLPFEPEPGDPHAPGPFAFADAARVKQILSDAAWRDISVEPFDFPMVAGAGDDPVEDAIAYWKRIGPAARAASEMESGMRERFWDRVRNLAQRHNHAGMVSLPAAAWIVTAQAG